MDNEKFSDEAVRAAFLKLSRNEAADAYMKQRERIRRYTDIQEGEAGFFLAQIADSLDLNEAQTKRLQAISHETSQRVIQAIRDYDKNSPALHPLDVVE